MDKHMTRRSLILAFFLTLCALWIVPDAHAKVTKVGPGQYHKQMHIPKALGGNNNFNNDDSYVSKDRHKQRHERRSKRQRDNDKTAGDENRTASDKTAADKRQGRRERQKNTRQRRQQQQQAYDSRPINGSATGVND
jgi:lipopolysaccharide export LptBFGC system permease protein LptF